MSPTAHWMFQWLDEFGVRDESDLELMIKSDKAIARLREIVSACPDWDDRRVDIKGRSIVAGSTMDLSGWLICGAYKCQVKRVETLFGRMWHYFDSIVLEGYSAALFDASLQNIPKRDLPELRFTLTQHARTLLYLRHIGADQHIIFHEKPHHFCENCFRELALESGIASVLDKSARSEMISWLSDRVDIYITDGPILMSDRWSYQLLHRESGRTYSGHFLKRPKQKKPTKRDVIDDVVRRSAASLVFDSELSKRLRLPLAEETEIILPLKDSPQRKSAELVALHLPLPVIEGLSTKDIIKLREDERPAFDRFQSALTHAIHEHMVKMQGEDARIIARTVVEEYVRPELADIERRLTAIKKAMTSKTGFTIAVGTTLATVGILDAIPLIVTTGAAAAATALSHVNKYIDDKTAIQLSDMYFLWQAQHVRH